MCEFCAREQKKSVRARKSSARAREHLRRPLVCDQGDHVESVQECVIRVYLRVSNEWDAIGGDSVGLGGKPSGFQTRNPQTGSAKESK